MLLWTAFLLGFIGSAHCAGMCGPLTLALPGGSAKSRFIVGRVLYNFGRVTTYVLLGALFGLIGRGFTVIGLQRWVSLSLGTLILVGLIASPRFIHLVPVSRPVAWLKAGLGRLFKSRSLLPLYGIGLLNGLLPCGLVYAACAAAIATSSTATGMVYMLMFGLGTIPLMLIISLLGTKLQFALRFKVQRLIPASLAIVGVMLLLRGLALGIPHLSPKLSPSPDGPHQCCHSE